MGIGGRGAGGREREKKSVYVVGRGVSVCRPTRGAQPSWREEIMVFIRKQGFTEVEGQV